MPTLIITAPFLINRAGRTKFSWVGTALGYKSSNDGSKTTTRKYIVDISGGLPTILCEIDTCDDSLKKAYV